MTVYSVTFARGSTVFDVVLATATGTLTSTAAESLAANQAAKADGPAVLPSTGQSSLESRAAYDIGGAVGTLAVLAVAIFLIVRASRRNRTRVPTREPHWATTQGMTVVPSFASSSSIPAHTAMPAGLASLPTFAPIVEPKAPAGWYPDPTVASLQRYFDGSDWTGHTAPR